MQFTIVTFLAFAASVSAHCVYRNPAVIAKAVRNDATQSRTCNVQQALANPVTADSTGAFTLAAQSFNAGVDGATAVKTATLDTTGKGQTFSGQVTIVQNGNPNPTASNTLSTIKLSLPSGTKCQGGTCLVFTTSDGGFTSCNAVIQSGATASSGTTGSTGKGNTATSGQTGNTGSSSGKVATNGNTGSNKTGNTGTNNTGNTGSNKTGGKKNNAAARKHHHKQANKKAPRMLRLSKEWIQ